MKKKNIQAVIPFIKEPKNLKVDISYISFNNLNNNELLSKTDDIKILHVIERIPKNSNEQNPTVGKILLVKGSYRDPEINKVFPIVWHAYLFQIHVLNELVNKALYGHDLPTTGMVFSKDIILKKGTIIKKEELWLENSEDEEETWIKLINTLGEIASGKYEIENSAIRITEDITLLKADHALENREADLINLIGLEIDMKTLIEKEFTLGQLMVDIYSSTGYSTYQYFYKDYKEVIRKRLNDILKRLSTNYFKGYLKKGQKKRSWRIKVFHDPKQVANFKQTCEKAIRELEGKLRQKGIQEYVRMFFTQEDIKEVNQ